MSARDCCQQHWQHPFKVVHLQGQVRVTVLSHHAGTRKFPGSPGPGMKQVHAPTPGRTAGRTAAGRTAGPGQVVPASIRGACRGSSDSSVAQFAVQVAITEPTRLSVPSLNPNCAAGKRKESDEEQILRQGRFFPPNQEFNQPPDCFSPV